MNNYLIWWARKRNGAERNGVFLLIRRAFLRTCSLAAFSPSVQYFLPPLLIHTFLLLKYRVAGVRYSTDWCTLSLLYLLKPSSASLTVKYTPSCFTDLHNRSIKILSNTRPLPSLLILIPAPSNFPHKRIACQLHPLIGVKYLRTSLAYCTA